MCWFLRCHGLVFLFWPRTISRALAIDRQGGQRGLSKHATTSVLIVAAALQRSLRISTRKDTRPRRCINPGIKENATAKIPLQAHQKSRDNAWTPAPDFAKCAAKADNSVSIKDAARQQADEILDPETVTRSTWQQRRRLRRSRLSAPPNRSGCDANVEPRYTDEYCHRCVG